MRLVAAILRVFALVVVLWAGLAPTAEAKSIIKKLGDAVHKLGQHTGINKALNTAQKAVTGSDWGPGGRKALNNFQKKWTGADWGPGGRTARNSFQKKFTGVNWGKGGHKAMRAIAEKLAIATILPVSPKTLLLLTKFKERVNKAAAPEPEQVVQDPSSACADGDDACLAQMMTACLDAMSEAEAAQFADSFMVFAQAIPATVRDTVLTHAFEDATILGTYCLVRNDAALSNEFLASLSTPAS